MTLPGIRSIPLWHTHTHTHTHKHTLTYIHIPTRTHEAFYHTGVEYGWFNGPTSCSETGESPDTIEELRSRLLSRPGAPWPPAADHPT